MAIENTKTNAIINSRLHIASSLFYFSSIMFPGSWLKNRLPQQSMRRSAGNSIAIISRVSAAAGDGAEFRKVVSTAYPEVY